MQEKEVQFDCQSFQRYDNYSIFYDTPTEGLFKFCRICRLGMENGKASITERPIPLFSKLTNREVDEARSQTCFSSKLVCNNEIMDVTNTRISNNKCIKRISFHIHMYKFYKNKLNLLVVFECRRYSRFSWQDLNFFLMVSLVNVTNSLHSKWPKLQNLNS